jgi:hypothetical protein
MANLSGFDARQVEPAGEFEPIPAGKYHAVITESDMKSTKSGKGSLLQLKFQITDGEFKNRILWTRLNLDNPNKTAVAIARAQLSAICRAVGVMAPNDSGELHNLPLIITVACKKREDTGDITNEIKGYASKNGKPHDEPERVLVDDVGTITPPWKRS